MTCVSLLAIVLFCWTRLRAKRGAVVPERLRNFVPPAALVYACASALVPLMLVQAWVLIVQVRVENGPPLTEAHKYLPIPVFDGRSFRPGIHAWYSYIAFFTGLCETACVAIVAVAVRRNVGHVLVPVLASATAGMLAIGLLCPAMSTTDPYEFAATSILGFASYAPPHGAFDGTAYAPIARAVPLYGVIYGPLWVVFDTLELGFVPTIIGKLIVLRLVNVGLLGLLAYLLQRVKVSHATIAALVGNPAVWYYVVLNPHAEIEGLVLIAAALLAAQRSRSWPAMVFVAAAGAVKITFLVVAAAALMPIPDARRRVLLWMCAAALAVGSSLLVPHNAYVGDAARYVAGSRFLTQGTVSGQWMLVAALAGLAMAALLLTGRRVSTGAWLFGQLAPLAAPWYLLWGLPYALVTGTATALLVSLPVATAALDLDFNVSPLPEIFLMLCIAGYVIEVVRTLSAPAPERLAKLH